MAETSPYKVFFNWLFDGNMATEIPSNPDLLKYNSPITHTFLLKLFIEIPKVNRYLNEHLNNINLRYIEKNDLFMFMKQIVKDFKLKRYDTHFYPRVYQHKLFNVLRRKFPLLKAYDIELLIDKINESNDNDKILSSLGIDKQKRKN